MAVDIRAMISNKEARKENKKLVLKDVNRDLIVALLGISVYGKEARDEDIMDIIIHNGVAVTVDKRFERIKEAYAKKVKNKEIKRTKNGVRDKNGFIVLVPRGM